MYNYGVIDNMYVIVMKKYTCSVRDWRLGNVEAQEAKLYPPTLPNILALFYEIIKGMKLLHDQNVTHYDIKCDNILLEFTPSKDPREPPKVSVVFADFGVAKIYED
jgi:serine/threonine protein kinase